MNEFTVSDERYEAWSNQHQELVEKLAPSEDYSPAIDCFTGGGHDFINRMQRLLDGWTVPLQYHSCRFPEITDEDEEASLSSHKGILFVFDLSFGDPKDDIYQEVLMPFSEFLRWMRAIARLRIEFFPEEHAQIQAMFHNRDLALLASEVGPNFNNGATWWGKIEEQRRVTIESCRTCLTSSWWRQISHYFILIPDLRFLSWLQALAHNHVLPAPPYSSWTSIATHTKEGGLRVPIVVWGTNPQQHVDIPKHEWDALRDQLVEAFCTRRPRHAREAQELLAQIKKAALV